MCSDKLSVDEAYAHPVNRFKMQNKSLLQRQFWQFNQTSIPEEFIGMQSTVNTGKRRFGREGHGDLAVPLQRHSRLHKSFPKDLRVGHSAQGNDRIVPHTVQRQNVIPPHARTRILGKNVRGIKLFSPYGRERIELFSFVLLRRAGKNPSDI